MQTTTYPIHERLLIGTLLTAAAGSFDAYTYLLHGEVFAGLQTGNVILLGVHLGQGQWYTAIRYLVPILAFMFGTMAARALQLHASHRSQPLAEQRWIIRYEIAWLLVVSLLGKWLPDLVASDRGCPATRVPSFKRWPIYVTDDDRQSTHRRAEPV